MKKLLLSAVCVLLLLMPLKLSAFAEGDVAEFNEAFLHDGKLAAPEENYMRVYEYEGNGHQVAREYTTQSDDVMTLLNDWDAIGDEAFYEKYGFKIYDVIIQHDCKLDDGEWHYEPSWDEFEYDYSDLPDYMCLYPTTPAFHNEKIVSSGYNIDLYYMDEDGSDWGFFKDVVVVKDGQFRVLDLENHTLHFRSRYILEFTKENSEGYDDYYKVYSDWCSETSVGKDGNQPELVNPEKLEAPILGDMKLLGQEENEALLWDVFWKIPDSVFNVAKYYWIIEDAFQPICIETQYRVNGGEWIDTLVANAASLYGGNRNFETFDTKENDTIEFRARFFCSWDEEKTSEWSDIVSNKAVDTKPSEKVKASDSKPGVLLSETENEAKCKLCGICPVQPLNICLFIWVLTVLLISIVIAFLVRKGLKNKGKDTKKATLTIVIMILVWVLILVLFIMMCKKNRGETKEQASEEHDTVTTVAEIKEEKDTQEPSSEPEEKKEETVTEEPSSEPETAAPETQGYVFSGYTDIGTWPTEEEWANMGLPYLELSENMDGSVAISDKNWIYPLNAANGIMFEAKPSDEQIDSFIDKLSAAGISGYYESESYPVRYIADYNYLGMPMRVELTQTEMIDMGGMGNNINPKITVLVLIGPND